MSGPQFFVDGCVEANCPASLAMQIASEIFLDGQSSGSSSQPLECTQCRSLTIFLLSCSSVDAFFSQACSHDREQMVLPGRVCTIVVKHMSHPATFRCNDSSAKVSQDMQGVICQAGPSSCTQQSDKVL